MERETGLELLNKNFSIHNFEIEPKFSDIEISQFVRNTPLRSPIIYNNVMVLGLGGIGGHVAEILGSMKDIQSIHLVDDDIVEMSNLNRTVFSYEDIGFSKVECATKIISNRNVNAIVHPYIDKFNEEFCKRVETEYMQNFRRRTFMVYDCRDNFFEEKALYDSLKLKLRSEFKIIRAAYNETSITIDLSPLDHPVWGNPGYTTVPSHSLPSRLAALLICIFGLHYDRVSQENPEIIKTPMTFDLYDIIPFIFNGVKGMTPEKNETQGFEDGGNGQDIDNFDSDMDPED